MCVWAQPSRFLCLNPHHHPQLAGSPAQGMVVRLSCLVPLCRSKLASRALLRRAWAHFATNIHASMLKGQQTDAACRMHNARIAKRCLHHWRMALARTRVVRAMLTRARDEQRLIVLNVLRIYCQHQQQKSVEKLTAQRHWSLAASSRVFSSWRVLVKRTVLAASLADAKANAQASGFAQRWLQRQVLQAWRQYVHVVRLPKVRSDSPSSPSVWHASSTCVQQPCPMHVRGAG